MGGEISGVLGVHPQAPFMLNENQDRFVNNLGS